MQTPWIDKYSDASLGNLVIMLSLDGVQPLLPFVGLKLDAPDAFQAICRDVTDRCPEAEYYEPAMGWNRWTDRVAAMMRQQPLSELSELDRRRVLFWFENGLVGTVHTFPHRSLWDEGIAWVANSDGIVDLVDGRTLNILKDFAVSVKEARLAEDYAAAKADLANGQETFQDTLQKTKFHINIVPDAIVSPHLTGLNYMRSGFILRSQTERFIAQGGDVALLERAVLLYADTQVTSKWRTDYVADRARFEYVRLWSNTFREFPA
jgi:hypothetical protein